MLKTALYSSVAKPKVCPEPSQTSKMERFAKVVDD